MEQAYSFLSRVDDLSDSFPVDSVRQVPLPHAGYELCSDLKVRRPYSELREQTEVRGAD